MIKVVLKSGNLPDKATAEDFADWVAYATSEMARVLPNIQVTALPFEHKHFVGHEVEGGCGTLEWRMVDQFLDGAYYKWLLRRFPPKSV